MSYSRPSWHDQQPSPKHDDVIEGAVLNIKVGSHNGDFRHIIIEDHLGRLIADGSVPYTALRQIAEARP